MQQISKYRKQLFSLLDSHHVRSELKDDSYVFKSASAEIQLQIPDDLLISSTQKLANIILSKLGLNKRIFARSCQVMKVDRKAASEFLREYHLMNDTVSASQLGLFYKEELISLATFSKGRKMDRLPSDKRSYELIRFCTKSGITVTGGLSRLVKHFCREKEAGDIMSYVDKQLSGGDAYTKAGFKLHSESGELTYSINKKDHSRRMASISAQQANDFYLEKGPGNIKMIFTCHD